MDYFKIIEKYYSLSKEERPEYNKIKVSPMTMESQSFELSGLGHMSLMRGTAMCGLMKMDTLVINPFEKDMPLFSLDRINVAGKETLLIEMYETRLEPVSLEQYFTDLIANYSMFEDGKTAPRWYDDIRLPESMHKLGKKKDASYFDNLSGEYLEKFLGLCKEAMSCDIDKKKAEAKKYTDGLLSNGGASTDLFVKKKGKEFTEKFFRESMFGV